MCLLILQDLLLNSNNQDMILILAVLLEEDHSGNRRGPGAPDKNVLAQRTDRACRGLRVRPGAGICYAAQMEARLK